MNFLCCLCYRRRIHDGPLTTNNNIIIFIVNIRYPKKRRTGADFLVMPVHRCGKSGWHPHKLAGSGRTGLQAKTTLWEDPQSRCMVVFEKDSSAGVRSVSR